MFIGFGLWHGAFTLLQVMPGYAVPTAFAVFGFIGSIGWIYWCYHLYKMIRMGKIMNANPALSHALNDELYKHLELKSYRNAFWIVMGITVLYIFISTTITVPINLLPNLIIFAGVMGTIGSFLYLNSQDQYE